MSKFRGVQDLFDRKGLQWKDIAVEMIESNVPGNWHRPQNIYNMIRGAVMPKDAYVYVVLARVFDVDLSIIISRYSRVGLNSSTDYERRDRRKKLEEVKGEFNVSYYGDEDDLF